MGYGRNALWLAERGYEVEGWEVDRRYAAEARRRAWERKVRLVVRRGDFTRGKWGGHYDAVVASAVLHMMRRSAALRVLKRMRKALARGARVFLMVKLTDDPVFRRLQKNPDWAPVRGEGNTLRFRKRGRPTGLAGPAGTPVSGFQSRLTRGEVRAALRGLRVLRWKERTLKSEWEEGESVTQRMLEVVAERV